MKEHTVAMMDVGSEWHVRTLDLLEFEALKDGTHDELANWLRPQCFEARQSSHIYPDNNQYIMSDREGPSRGPPPADDDLSLPKATVAKMISGMHPNGLCPRLIAYILAVNSELLPSDVVCAKETRDLVIECCVGEQ